MYLSYILSYLGFFFHEDDRGGKFSKIWSLPKFWDFFHEDDIGVNFLKFGIFPNFGISSSMKMKEEEIFPKFGAYPEFGILFFELSEIDFLFLS